MNYPGVSLQAESIADHEALPPLLFLANSPILHADSITMRSKLFIDALLVHLSN